MIQRYGPPGRNSGGPFCIVQRPIEEESFPYRALALPPSRVETRSPLWGRSHIQWLLRSILRTPVAPIGRLHFRSVTFTFSQCYDYIFAVLRLHFGSVTITFWQCYVCLFPYGGCHLLLACTGGDSYYVTI